MTSLQIALQRDDLNLAEKLIKQGEKLLDDPIYSVESIQIGIDLDWIFQKKCLNDIIHRWNSDGQYDQDLKVNLKKYDRINFLLNQTNYLKHNIILLNNIIELDASEDITSLLLLYVHEESVFQDRVSKYKFLNYLCKRTYINLIQDILIKYKSDHIYLDLSHLHLLSYYLHKDCPFINDLSQRYYELLFNSSFFSPVFENEDYGYRDDENIIFTIDHLINAPFNHKLDLLIDLILKNQLLDFLLDKQRSDAVKYILDLGRSHQWDINYDKYYRECMHVDWDIYCENTSGNHLECLNFLVDLINTYGPYILIDHETNDRVISLIDHIKLLQHLKFDRDRTGSLILEAEELLEDIL